MLDPRTVPWRTVRPSLVLAGLACSAVLASAGCDRGSKSGPARAPDTASAREPERSLWLPAGELPAADVRERPPVVAVAPSRDALAALPAAEPDAPPGAPGPEGLPAPEDELKPPIPRAEVVVRWPAGSPPRAVVELDVRVDEGGRVSDAVWAAGDEDSARVAAAIDAALSQRFFPALRRGHAVAVWCRQRFARASVPDAPAR